MQPSNHAQSPAYKHSIALLGTITDSQSFNHTHSLAHNHSITTNTLIIWNITLTCWDKAGLDYNQNRLARTDYCLGRNWMTKPKSRPYKGWSVLSVSGPDWPKTRRADWPISVVLIGQNHGSHQSPLMELSNTIHTQCTRKRTLNAIIHTAIHNVHSHTSHSHNKFKQTRDRQQQWVMRLREQRLKSLWCRVETLFPSNVGPPS